ncbi:MAG: alkaline phosphatase family protein [Candidatus Theseobacter exili]|nr:alkaline phosphatase family protein [Candidatus Theseobacter exili]
MDFKFKNSCILSVLIMSFIFAGSFASSVVAEEKMPTAVPVSEEVKLYWFIPDGMRSEDTIFNIYKWAEEGKLPNIKRMIEEGSYGYSIPVFPSHTPTNFATLFTGTYPVTHGVADGPMHVEGNPLNIVSVGGFNSAAKKVPPIWVNMERGFDKDVVLLSIPGSTPPELEEGITLRGRWGGYGADFHAVNFESIGKGDKRFEHGRGARLFFFGPYLTSYLESRDAGKWENPPVSFLPPREMGLGAYGAMVFAYIYDSTDDKKVNYNRVAFSFDKKNIFADLVDKQWSSWNPITLQWKGISVATDFKIKIIRLEPDGNLKIRFFFNNLNEYIVKPSSVAKEVIDGVGPMVDFVDNFPAQLVFEDADKETFIEEADMSLEWHRKAAAFILDKYDPDVFIQDIYTPNQMLTSRWWMGYIDPSSIRYKDIDEEKRSLLWAEVKDMYQKLDSILGVMLNKADENTLVVLSSDHGAIPLNKWVCLNNFFAKKGWLKFAMDKKTGEPVINWAESKVIYLKMDSVYIDPEGLDGDWKRASGEEYEKLREEVKTALLEIQDSATGNHPVIGAYKCEEVADVLKLPEDRVGDLVVVNRAGYGWNEEMSADLSIIKNPGHKSGYKQAILADKEKGMWTPFVIVGPGVKKGFQIKKPISHVDQYPTILFLMGKKIPGFVDGKVLNDIVEQKESN